MSRKTVDLRPDRRKLKTNFDGYKLSLDPVPVLKYEVPIPERVATSDKQFSYLHAQLFGLYNHLVRDPWHPCTAYYIDNTWTVQKIEYCTDTGKMKPVQAVLKLAKNSAGDRYPMSLIFVSDKLCLIGDGCGRLMVTETGDRGRHEEFKARYNGNPIDGLTEGFILRDARLDTVGEESVISCVLVSIQQGDEQHFETVANWVNLKNSETGWKVDSNKVIKSRGAFTYCGIEPGSKAILIASDYPVDFLSNIIRVEEEKRAKEAALTETSNGTSKEDTETMEKDITHYSWAQTEDDVTINFNKREGCSRQDYTVQVTKSNIVVKCRAEVLLNGDLFNEIDTDSTTWTVQNNFLQILLIKASPINWPYLVLGAPVESLQTQAGTATDFTEPNPVRNIQDQMEECDFGEFGEDRENYIYRLIWEDESISNYVYLGSTPPLFEVTTQPGFPNAVALKHDVDACIWTQKSCTPITDWTMHHEDTIDAFSYVQASKQQKKFTSCAPDASYVVICEPERHVFIYKKAYEGAANLRNRNGQQVNIGQQKLVALDNVGEVIGISVEKDVTMLLTATSYLVCLQLSIEE